MQFLGGEMRRMRKILFTGGGGAGSEALARLLADRYEVHFADADLQAIDSSIPQDRRHGVPFANDPAFADRLCDLMQREKIDLLLPGVDEELPVVAQLAEQGCIQALLPPLHFVRRHLDKYASMQFLREHQLAAPRTVFAEQAQEIGFPCIIKPRSGRGSRGVAVVHSQEQLQAGLIFNRAGKETFIAQELGVGEEFTVMVAADADGILRAVVPVAVELKRGITLRARTCFNEAVVDACRRVHEADPVPGCYNVQLMLQEDGRILIFEINPRVSTTLCLGIAAGVDPIALYLDSQGAAGSLLPFLDRVQLCRNWVNHLERNDLR